MNGRLRCQILTSLFVIILIALPPQAKAVDFDTWLAEFSAEASAKGISASTLKNALVGIRPIPRVVELDRRQPEFTLTFSDYMKRVVTATRIKKARARYDKHKVLLDRGP